MSSSPNHELNTCLFMVQSAKIVLFLDASGVCNIYNKLLPLLVLFFLLSTPPHPPKTITKIKKSHTHTHTARLLYFPISREHLQLLINSYVRTQCTATMHPTNYRTQLAASTQTAATTTTGYPTSMTAQVGAAVFAIWVSILSILTPRFGFSIIKVLS